MAHSAQLEIQKICCRKTCDLDQFDLEQPVRFELYCDANIYSLKLKSTIGCPKVVKIWGYNKFKIAERAHLFAVDYLL